MEGEGGGGGGGVGGGGGEWFKCFANGGQRLIRFFTTSVGEIEVGAECESPNIMGWGGEGEGQGNNAEAP